MMSADEISDLSKGDRRSGCSVLEVARFSFGQSCGIGLVRFGYASGVWAKFAMPLVVRGGTASFRAPDLVLELRRSRRG